MKYEVKFSCGHTATVELFGKASERESKIAYLEKYAVCPYCKKEQAEIEKSIGCKEVEMSYREYKTKYVGCKTKAGSYNGETKTIVVYVPESEN